MSEEITELHIPHPDLILTYLRVSIERLNSQIKIVVPARILRELLVSVTSMLPFDEAYYRSTYPDLAEAKDAGHIADLRNHYINTGWFEGRFGVDPGVDEAFYLAEYPDVRRAVERGDVASAAEHYLRAGAAEGRLPNAGAAPALGRWRAAME